MCATSFIVSVIQHIKIGDLTKYPSKLPIIEDQDFIGADHDIETETPHNPRLSREEERSLARDSTVGFAGNSHCSHIDVKLDASNIDWVTSLLRRILALYENLPEEGGRRNTTGGKQEESVLKSIKSMMDVICLHLSDDLFELVLNILYDYATTNAKSNAVQAFGQLISCLARVKPDLTTAKFLPFCISQIEDELKHGASSIRTTSSHIAVPSDTTLHWSE
jgi:proteasome activator subunit 4